MRFKSIFWLFNIVVVLALLIFAVSSFLVFGKDYASMYWGNMWIVVLLFALLIAVLDFYFIRNWKLFELLEQEDWTSLRNWLDDAIFTRGRLNRAYAGLMINAVLADVDGDISERMDVLERLELAIRDRKPHLMRSLGVSVGIARLLPVIVRGLSPGLAGLSDEEKNSIAAYFAPLAEDKRSNGVEWARFWSALAAGDAGEAVLAELTDGSDMSVRLLSYHMLSGSGDGSVRDEHLTDSIHRLKADLAGSKGDKALRNSREENVMAAVMASSVNEARVAIQGS